MSKRFSFTPTSIPGLWVARRAAILDSRGSFSRLFCADEFSGIGVRKPIVQINQSINTNSGTTRGLHFQNPPHAEIKIVMCVRGKVFDVSVDLRRKSETFLHWHGEILSAENQKSMVIPEGFAHGFQTLTKDCELIYFHTEKYVPEADGGLHVLDPQIGISWPLPVHSLSERDAHHPFITEKYSGIVL